MSNHATCLCCELFVAPVWPFVLLGLQLIVPKLNWIISDLPETANLLGRNILINSLLFLFTNYNDVDHCNLRRLSCHV